MGNSNGRTVVSIEDNTFSRSTFSYSNAFILLFYSGLEGGKAYGCRGSSFHIIIQCTNDWPDECYKPVGQGTVHDYLLKNVMGIESDQKRIACGGFSYLFGELRFSSVWLNGTNQTDAESDGSRYLSEPEQMLVTYCWEEYKTYGAHHVFFVPSFIDRLLSN